MYKIVIDDDKTVQDSIDNLVISPTLTEKLNGVSSLEYTIPFNDTLYDSYKRRITKVCVYNDDILQFKGRLLKEKVKFDGSKTLTFEGELAYLNDVQFPPFAFEGDYPDLFKRIIDYYNSKCDSDKQFVVGRTTFLDTNNYVTRSSESYNSCWNTINEKILNYGGYLKLRYVGDIRYIDLLNESGDVSNQKIEFGKNLLDLENYIDTSSIATVLIPLGAKQSEVEELEDGVTRTYTADCLDIRSVNNDVEYVESELSKTLGRVEIVENWDDVTIPQNLLNKAKKRLSELILENQTISVKAVDLFFSEQNISYFKIGDIIPVVSVPHNVDTTMILTAIKKNLNDPAKDNYELGTKKKKLTSTINNSIKNEIDKSINSQTVNNIIKHQTKLLADGKNGNIIFGYNDFEKLSEFYFADTDDLNTAVNVLKINKSGIGFSNDGVFGTYRNAWTIDGILSADFIQTGILQSINSKFKIDLTTGKATLLDGEFTGKITSSSGTIAGFTISDQYIQSKNQNVGLGLTDDWAFWAGGSTTATANFRVTSAGKVFAKNIEITGGKISSGNGKYSLDLSTGKVIMQDGDFTGKITSNSGTIGGLTIYSSYLLFEGPANVPIGTGGQPVKGTVTYAINKPVGTNDWSKLMQWEFKYNGSTYWTGSINPYILEIPCINATYAINCKYDVVASEGTMMAKDFMYTNGYTPTFTDASGATSVSREAFASDYIHVAHRNGAAAVGVFWDIGSDLKLKNSIIKSHKKALDDLNKIKFYDFYYNDKMKHEVLGFVADQLEDVNSDFVNEFEDNDIVTLIPNRQTLLVYCVKAIQELYEMMRG